MSCGNTINLGVFTTGEIPAPLLYQFLDWQGAPIDLTGYTAKFQWWRTGTTAATENATVTDAPNGRVQYVWTGAEFTLPGGYQAQFWVGNLTTRWASDLIKWTVRAAGGPVPSI